MTALWQPPEVFLKKPLNGLLIPVGAMQKYVGCAEPVSMNSITSLLVSLYYLVIPKILSKPLM